MLEQTLQALSRHEAQAADLQARLLHEARNWSVCWLPQCCAATGATMPSGGSWRLKTTTRPPRFAPSNRLRRSSAASTPSNCSNAWPTSAAGCWNWDRAIRSACGKPSLRTRLLDQYRQTLLADDPRVGSLEVILGGLYSNDGDSRRAAPLLEKALAYWRHRRPPDDLRLAQTLRLLAENSLLIVPAPPTATIQGYLDEAYRLCLAHFPLDPLRWRTQLDLGRLYLATGQYRQAWVTLQALLDPPAPLPVDIRSEALLQLGLLHQQLLRFDEAERLCRQALEVRQSVPDASDAELTPYYLALGSLQIARRDAAALAEIVERSAALDLTGSQHNASRWEFAHQQAMVHYLRNELAGDGGERQAARTIWERLLADEADFPPALRADAAFPGPARLPGLVERCRRLAGRLYKPRPADGKPVPVDQPIGGLRARAPSISGGFRRLRQPSRRRQRARRAAATVQSLARSARCAGAEKAEVATSSCRRGPTGTATSPGRKRRSRGLAEQVDTRPDPGRRGRRPARRAKSVSQPAVCRALQRRAVDRGSGTVCRQRTRATLATCPESARSGRGLDRTAACQCRGRRRGACRVFRPVPHRLRLARAVSCRSPRPAAATTSTWSGLWSLRSGAAAGPCSISCAWPTSPIRAPCRSSLRSPRSSCWPISSAAGGSPSNRCCTITSARRSYLFVLGGSEKRLQAIRLRTSSATLESPAGASAIDLHAYRLYASLSNEQTAAAIPTDIALRQRLAASSLVLLPAVVREYLEQEKARGASYALVVPHGAAAQIPLEALVVKDGEAVYLDDVAPPLAYAPSLALLDHLSRIAPPASTAPSVLTLGNPDYQSQHQADPKLAAQPANNGVHTGRRQRGPRRRARAAACQPTGV